MVEYEKFGKYLEEQNGKSFYIKFEEIEKIIGEKLPNSAYQYTAWWSNSDSHPLMKVVLSKNWKSKDLDLDLKSIYFYNSTESSLLQFLKYNMRMLTNYQPIVIKMLLESKNHSTSIQAIREKFQELNFDRGTFVGSGERQLGNTAISSVKEALDYWVSFPEGTSNGDVKLIENQFNESEIKECLKICGQKISKWHLEHFMKEKNNFYFIQAGEENQYLDEFKATKSVGVSYREFGSFDLSNLNKKEILEKTNGKFGTELDNISKIQLGDIILVTEGRINGITEFGIVTKEYFFQEQSETYKHRVNVEFLNFGNENINRGAGKAILRVEDAKKISEIRIALGEESGNYYIITQNPGSKYDDIEGEQYAFDSDKSHYKKFIKNTNFIVQTKIDGQYYFTGYGKVGHLEKTNSVKENGRKITHIIAKFSKYKKFKEQKVRTDEINQKMLKIAFPNSGSNPQPPAMLEIPKVLYQEITEEDLIHNVQISNILTEYSQTIEILKRKKNIILYGPPGTGKTFTAKIIAKQMNGISKSVTFHQSYGYEEFIEGIRPQPTDNGITYPVKPGVFKKFCQSLPRMNWKQAAIYVLNEKDVSLHYKEITKISTELEIEPAHNISQNEISRKTPWFFQGREITEDIRINKENSIFKRSVNDNGKEIPGMYELNKESSNYENEILKLESLKNNDLETPKIFIIDEINRGNISKIFGELITIIENDKRGTEVTLAYSGEQFKVPSNVYIIGTMNTADQSLTHIDAALKRRFSSIEVMPDSSILKKGMKGLPELLDKINEKVRGKISRDNQIGHSYFMQDEKPITEIKELQFVFATDIIPLLRDYFYDSDDDLKEVLGEQFIDWDEGSNRNVKKDWQNNLETFRAVIKKAYNVTI